MELNIERLHACLSGEMDGVRQAGHTTALLVSMIQSASLVSGTYVFIVQNRHAVNSLIDKMSYVYEVIYPHAEGLTIIPGASGNDYVESGLGMALSGKYVLGTPTPRLTIIRRNGYVEFGDSKIIFMARGNIHRATQGIKITNYYYSDLDSPLTQLEFNHLQQSSIYL